MRIGTVRSCGRTRRRWPGRCLRRPARTAGDRRRRSVGRRKSTASSRGSTRRCRRPRSRCATGWRFVASRASAPGLGGAAAGATPAGPRHVPGRGTPRRTGIGVVQQRLRRGRATTASATVLDGAVIGGARNPAKNGNGRRRCSALSTCPRRVMRTFEIPLAPAPPNRRTSDGDGTDPSPLRGTMDEPAAQVTDDPPACASPDPPR
jgi:hypothetical protein